MNRAIQLFDHSYHRIKNLHSLYDHLTENLHYNNKLGEEILRSEIVYIVSALDKLIHDLVKKGMIETMIGRRSSTNSYLKFPITLDQMNNMSGAISGTSVSIFENIIIENQKHLSYQNPEKISIALSLIWDENYKWQKIADICGSDQQTIKIELNNIVIRRNQIVHEADLDLFIGSEQLIDKDDVRESVDFIHKLAHVIYNLVKLP